MALILVVVVVHLTLAYFQSLVVQIGQPPRLPMFAMFATFALLIIVVMDSIMPC